MKNLRINILLVIGMMWSIGFANAQGFGIQLVHPKANTAYYLSSTISGMVLDLESSSANNGVKIIQSKKNGSLSQQWTFVSKGDGYYQVINKQTGKALDVAQGSKAPGGYIHQWEALSVPNQMFRLQQTIQGFHLVAKHSGLSLMITPQSYTKEGTVVIQDTKNIGSPFQRFSLTRVSPERVAKGPYSSWMDDNKEFLNNKTLRDIILPGSHDASTAIFERPYIIANENNQDALVTIANKVKPLIPDDVFYPNIAKLAQTQSGRVLAQLEAGSRYLDLRPYQHNGKVYNSHTLLVQSMEEVINDVNTFLFNNPNEIIILHERQNGFDNNLFYQAYWKYVLSRLEPKLIVNNNTINKTYKDLIQGHYERRIIYVPFRNRPPSKYYHSVNEAGNWLGNGVSGPKLIIGVQSALSKKVDVRDAFSLLSLAYTPTEEEYIKAFPVGKSLHSFHNGYIKNQIVQNMDSWYTFAGKGMNILMTDFITENPAFVEKVIKLNKKTLGSGTNQ